MPKAPIITTWAAARFAARPCRTPIDAGPSAIFAEAFAALSELACPALRREGKQVLRLIDATPIPLTSLHKWTDWNGRTRV